MSYCRKGASASQDPQNLKGKRIWIALWVLRACHGKIPTTLLLSWVLFKWMPPKPPKRRSKKKKSSPYPIARHAGEGRRREYVIEGGFPVLAMILGWNEKSTRRRAAQLGEWVRFEVRGNDLYISLHDEHLIATWAKINEQDCTRQLTLLAEAQTKFNARAGGRQDEELSPRLGQLPQTA